MRSVRNIIEGLLVALVGALVLLLLRRHLEGGLILGIAVLLVGVVAIAWNDHRLEKRRLDAKPELSNLGPGDGRGAADGTGYGYGAGNAAPMWQDIVQRAMDSPVSDPSAPFFVIVKDVGSYLSSRPCPEHEDHFQCEAKLSVYVTVPSTAPDKVVLVDSDLDVSIPGREPEHHNGVLEQPYRGHLPYPPEIAIGQTDSVVCVLYLNVPRFVFEQRLSIGWDLTLTDQMGRTVTAHLDNVSFRAFPQT